MNRFLAKTIFGILGIILVSAFLICHNIQQEIDERSLINASFASGYECAAADYSSGKKYHSSVAEGYDNFQTISKLAHDAGYGFGWSDAENGSNENAATGYEYDYWSPDWMYSIYYLFK